METLRLKPRQPVEDDIECWDDDDFLIETDDITIQSQSTSTNPPSHRRDSYSSFRSDFESVTAEEEKQFVLPGEDEKSTLDAIAAAAKAGIPIPKNVPPSALMGGTIKRLGGRKIKRIIQEDWVDDLEFPDSGQMLQFKPRDSSHFPDVLRHVSGLVQRSPAKPVSSSPTKTRGEQRTPRSSMQGGLINLDIFRDTEDDDDFFGDGEATIKVTKKREILPPDDFVLPVDGKLRLSSRRDIPKTPALNTSVEDLEWAEGSLGTRFGGTRRDGRSNRSSSASALSPSIASSITAESEDEALDGLVLPTGPLNFEERLNQRRKSRSPERPGQPEQPERSDRPERPERPERSERSAATDDSNRTIRGLPKEVPKEEKEDFLCDLDIGDGEVFDSKKLTLHHNIQYKEPRPASPSRPKATVALKFNKPGIVSRLPRPMGPSMVSHERSHTQSSLEPVSESGGPVTHTRRSLSRMGHSTQSSVNSVNSFTGPLTPSTTQSFNPSTPRRKELGPKTSLVSLRTEPTTTSAQLLRLKRSMPAMRSTQSPARPPTTTRNYERPPSRTDMAPRPPSSMRPKTPVERLRTNESAAAQARKAPLPFLPAGTSASQSHNVLAKSSSRSFRRHDSENSIEYRPSSRAVSRSTVRSPSPRKYYPGDKLVSRGAHHQLHKPQRARQFGDGHELDGFDDLPTSSQAEARYLRQPIAPGPKTHVRNRLYQNILPDRNTPSPGLPYSPARMGMDYVPSFARDTTASRIARETSLAQRTPSGPLAPLTAQRLGQISARGNLSPQPHTPQMPPSSAVKSRKSRKIPQTKPHLIANLNPPKDSKMVGGMCYNPETFSWEGNDNILNAFEAPPTSSASTASAPRHLAARERENATPRPALITNIGPTKGVQVVGGMVFDPQNMCWLKLAPQQHQVNANAEPKDTMDGFNAIDNEDEEDVFKDIPDLEDHTMDSSESHGRNSDIKDDWLVGEEFDVGPEFVRRQREEEERWRKKCSMWFNGQGERGDAWKWALRDMVIQGSLR
ncbi:hypothetical protein B0T17DRAFT_622316 [Bombardia bombarda]|uniref:Cytokinesis regulator n=1 Tax=Bombardia bombarda TaxID=252184 RepID=A0AA40CDS9_9PEZI|nr:hypothetical protein B0T17DRAFT_622316 [Bombardia bombarda]